MMIKLSENRTALANLALTFQAIDTIQGLIEHCEKDVPGPVHCQFGYLPSCTKDVQFDRKVILDALMQQYDILVNYLADIGIDAKA